MPTYKRFEELPVWQKAKALAVSVYEAARKDPFRKDFGLVGQITRAALSVPSNVAEGFERGRTREFIRYLQTARGSCGEVRSQLAVARELGYLDQQTYQSLHEMCLETARQLTSFADYLRTRIRSDE